MELVKTLMLTLYVLTYGGAAPCNKESTAKVVLVKANGEKEVVRSEDIEDLLKSISLADQQKKRDESIRKKDLYDGDVSTNHISHYIIIPDGKDSVKQREKKTTDINDAALGKASVHHNVPRQSTSPEQGIWAWRGKKDSMRETHGKRSWNYFSKKMRNFMKKHGKGKSDKGNSKEDAYRYVIAQAQRDADSYSNDMDE